MKNREYLFVALAVAALAAIVFAIRPTEQESFARKIESMYAEDTFGGATPEETLALFVTALKSGATDQAAKYFVIDQQETWREGLKNIAAAGLMNSMITDIQDAESVSSTTNTATYGIRAADGTMAPLMLVQGKNGKWKIESL